MSDTISLADIRMLLQTVDAGLCSGVGDPVPGSMCVEAAVCYAIGLPHGDGPHCVGWAVRSAVILINDSNWSSNKARAKGLRKLAVAQLGSDQIDQDRFLELYVLKVIQKMCQPMFAELAKLAESDEDREAMESAGRACATASSLQEAITVLAYGRSLGLTLNLDRYLAIDVAIYLALNLASYLRHASDETLAMLADLCLEVLVEMESPGCQWLWLCEVKSSWL